MKFSQEVICSAPDRIQKSYTNRGPTNHIILIDPRQKQFERNRVHITAMGVTRAQNHIADPMGPFPPPKTIFGAKLQI